MKRANLELTVGFFVLIGLICLAYLAINLGKIEIYGEGYQIYANFDNASGLKTGATVEVAGVEVGRVVSIQLTPEKVILWDAIGGRPIGAPIEHGGKVLSVAFSPDGNTLAVAG